MYIHDCTLYQTHQFTKVFDWHWLGGEGDSQVLVHDGHQQTGQGVGRLAQYVADEALGNVTTDREAERLLRGHWNEEGFSSGGPGGRGGLEPNRVFCGEAEICTCTCTCTSVFPC